MLTRNCLCTSCLCWWILNLQHPQQREYNCTLIMSCTLALDSNTVLWQLHSRTVPSCCTLVSVSRTLLSRCTLALHCHHCTLDSLYPRLCLSQCTLDSVDSLFPHLCTLSHSALILHSARLSFLCSLCLCTLAVYSQFCTLALHSTLYSQPLVTVLSVPRQCDTVVVTQVQHRRGCCRRGWQESDLAS